MVNTDPSEGPAGRLRRQVVAVPRRNDREKARARADALRRAPVQLELTKPRKRKLKEHERQISRADALHAIPVVALWIRARLEVAEVSSDGSPPGRTFFGVLAHLNQSAQARGPNLRRFRTPRATCHHVGLLDFERTAAPQCRFRGAFFVAHE